MQKRFLLLNCCRKHQAAVAAGAQWIGVLVRPAYVGSCFPMDLGSQSAEGPQAPVPVSITHVPCAVFFGMR